MRFHLSVLKDCHLLFGQNVVHVNVMEALPDSVANPFQESKGTLADVYIR